MEATEYQESRQSARGLREPAAVLSFSSRHLPDGVCISYHGPDHAHLQAIFSAARLIINTVKGIRVVVFRALDEDVS
jgi:hypothetical protein